MKLSVVCANRGATIISLRLGFRRNEEQTENFFGILISTRLGSNYFPFIWSQTSSTI